MKALIQSVIIITCCLTPAYSAIETTEKAVVNVVSTNHVLHWTLGLIIVLALFFALVWIMKKMGALPVHSKDGLRIVGGLSLGMREKLVLVQVGEKQLLLGITPLVEKLLVLESEETLFNTSQPGDQTTDFSQKLKQVLSGETDE